jgi:5'-nucleotidase
MRFLLTNDDGIYARGLAAIKQELEKLGDVTVIAPITEQSAVGHAITIADPLKVIPISRAGEFYGYGITGSPADCVKLGISCIMKPKPDIIVSGINRGENVGINVLYSGTVSAATEALILGYTGIALSATNYLNPDYTAASIFGSRLAATLAKMKDMPPVALNVNCPSLPLSKIRGIRITKQSNARLKDKFVKRIDPRGNIYYWQAGRTSLVDSEKEPDSDAACLKNRMISIMPIHYQLGWNGDPSFLKNLNLKRLLK